MPQFFETAMGRRYYEHTVPELVRQLRRLNDNLDRLVDPEGAISEGQRVLEGEARATVRPSPGYHTYHPSIGPLLSLLVRLNAYVARVLGGAGEG